MALPVSIRGLVRGLVFSASGVTALAVALGHGATDPSRDRWLSPARPHSINGYLFLDGNAEPRLLDAETGRLGRVRARDAGHLEYVSCSPWRDGRGQAQLVALWDDTSGEGAGHLSRALGLARLTYPEGQTLDRVPLEIIPTSVPCWYPGMTARVLFAAADGRLYRFSFEPAAGIRPAPDDDLGRPRVIDWQAAQPGDGGLLISDPMWPDASRLKGKLLVTLSFVAGSGDRRVVTESQIWWLQLNAEGTTIEAAGRLTTPDATAEERWPALAESDDGKLILAYLSRRQGRGNWLLRVAAVTVDPVSGTPRLGPSRAVPQADDCVTTAPVFSADGRWLHALTRRAKSSTRVTRLATDRLLATSARVGK